MMDVNLFVKKNVLTFKLQTERSVSITHIVCCLRFAVVQIVCGQVVSLIRSHIFEALKARLCKIFKCCVKCRRPKIALLLFVSSEVCRTETNIWKSARMYEIQIVPKVISIK